MIRSILIILLPVLLMPAAGAQNTAQEHRWVAISQTAVRDRLREPASARFEGVYFKRARLNGREIPVVCGRVNSRNGFGGMTGFQRFIASGENLVFLEEEVADFETAWQSICLPRPRR
tara:strand:- start:1281 stop:1634 length:354 start_codon:yes stop_codon:yes gene_type:complete